jgi:hypothetical protein
LIGNRFFGKKRPIEFQEFENGDERKQKPNALLKVGE